MSTDQRYGLLHRETFSRRFRRSSVFNLVLCLLLLVMASQAYGQCANNNTLTGPAITPPCPGSTTAPCVQGGQYALVNVVTGNIYTFSTCGGATFDTQITLYNNTGGASLGYNDDGCAPQSTVTWTATYTGALRVLVDLYNCANNTTCATVTITCALPPPVPANDNPCGATPLSVGTSCTYVNSTTAGATATTGVPAPGCAIYNGGDVWFSAVVPASGRIVFDSNTGGITDAGMALYTTAPNTCSGTFTLVECDDDDSPNGNMSMIDRSGLTPGTTVWIRFWEYGNDVSGTFQICAYSPVPPANDNPCGATVLSVTTSCTPIAGTTAFATGTTGPPAPTCANYTGGDVWYRIVVPAGGAVIIETFAGTITDGGMAVYTAPSCTGTFVQEFCDDDGGPGLMPFLSMTGLAPGSSIWVRFWEYGNDNPGTFTICAHTPPPPPTGDCVYVLNLFDSFGDGWGSSNVGVRINGGPWTYYTVGGNTNQILLGMMIGDFIELSYDASGPFQGENSFSLGLLGGGTYFNSGAGPPGGPSFGQLVNCIPPPAAPQDCNGGATICNGQAFNNNSSNTGNVVDLNTANQGCLASGERQGTWYYFSPSSNGTVGFTISPVVATDYDFAVWGPMSSVTCPPPGPPVRCSYAAPVGDTGLGNGATDASEGAGGDRWVSTLPVIAGQIYILYVDNFSSNGQAFNLNWQLSGGASLDCSLLPVELVNLKGVQRHEGIELTWTTLSETGSDHFLVERSSDAFRFAPVNTIAAAGTSHSTLEYTIVDPTPQLGSNYYRITMVDSDGTVSISNTIQVTLSRSNIGLVVVPNPTNNAINLTLSAEHHDVVIRIRDSTGRLLLNQWQRDGHISIRVPVDGLDAGLYTVSIEEASGTLVGISSFVKE